MSLRAASACLCGLLIAVSRAPAGAQSPPFVVEMPGECGTEQGFRARVAQLLGSPADDLPWPTGSMHFQERAEGGYRLESALPQGTRALEDADCANLMSAAVVMVATAVDPSRGLHEDTSSAPPQDASRAPQEDTVLTHRAEALSTPTPPVESAPAARNAPGTSPRSLAAPEPRTAAEGADDLRAIPLSTRDDATAAPLAPAHEPREKARFLLGAGAGLVLGLVPSTQAHVELGAGARVRGFSARLTIRYVPPRDAAVPDGEVRVQAVGGTLGLGYAVVRWLELGLGLDGHALHGRGRGFAGAQEDFAYTLGGRVEGFGTVVERAGGSLALGAACLYQPRAPVFANQQGEALLSASSWGFQAGMRGAWEFF